MNEEAQKICDLIEKVDPEDSDALHEIDGRVGCYLSKFDYKDRHKSIASLLPTWNFKHFTRSRDALKAIRPDGWFINIENIENGDDTGLGWLCGITHSRTRKMFWSKYTNHKWLPTEELAELHAIIQAIDYERESDER